MKILKRLKRAADGYLNEFGNYGQTGSNIASAGQYINNYITRQPVTLRAMYRTSFLIRRVCDSRAEDMTKAGIRIDSDLQPDAIESVQNKLKGLQFWQQLSDVIRWSNLFGTAFLMPVLDGHDTEKPIDINAIGQGDLIGFQVFDRWQVIPSWEDGRILSLGRDNGYPIYYRSIANGMGIPNIKIHHTRLLRVDATPLPFIDRYTENFFSVSVVEAILDRVKAFDQASYAAVALIEAARNDVIFTDTLPQVAGENAGLYDRISAKFNEVMRFRSNNGLTLLATDERMERFSTTLAGVADVIDRMGEQVAGATEIPLARLLGKSSGGLNGGDDDLLSAYYDDINRRQENILMHPVEICVKIAMLSLGLTPKQVAIHFNNLGKSTAVEKADIASKAVTTITAAVQSQLITPKTGAKELKQLTEETGYFSNITDEGIEAMPDEIQQPEPQSFAGDSDSEPLTVNQILTAAIADIEQNGFDSEIRIEQWMTKIREAIESGQEPEEELLTRLKKLLALN